MAQQPIVVGIHFGATNVCIATHQDFQIKIIPNEYGLLTSPNRVSFLGEDTEAPLIGNSSKLITFPQCTVFDIKKIIGRKFDDQLLQNNINFYPFQVVEGPNQDTYLKVESRLDMFAPELVASFVFGYVKQLVYMFYGMEEVESPADIVTILSVPNYFNQEQKEALKESCEFNNITVLDICRESQCACYAYSLDKNLRNEYVLTLSMGGTSFLMSIEFIDDNGNITLKESDGDVYLGGDDFDNRIVKYCCTKFKENYNLDIRENAMRLRFLKNECEKAKIKLTIENEATVRVKGDDQQIYELNLTRSIFEELNKDLFESCIQSIEKLIEQAKINKSDIRNIVLMGGSFAIPELQELLRNFFSDNCELNAKFILNSIAPDNVIAYGSALYASEKDLSTLSKKESSIDINPVSVGIEIFGCIMKSIIERNAFIPCKRTVSIATCAENQKKLVINILEGERLVSKHDKTIGSIEIPIQDGTSSFDVEFEIDLTYTLQVNVYEKGKSKDMPIHFISIPNYFSHLNPEEIFEMVKESSHTIDADKTTLKMIHQLIVPSLITNPDTTCIQLIH